jgi:hypothetical protein
MSTWEDLLNAKKKYEDLEKSKKKQDKIVNTTSKELTYAQIEHLKCLVGRCYDSDLYYFVVSGTPAYKVDQNNFNITNIHQLPVICLEKFRTSLPFETTKFSDAVEYEDPIKAMSELYDEISKEQFLELYNKRVQNILNLWITNVEKNNFITYI